MEKEILGLLPEIKKIKEKDLKKRVIMVWEEGINLGGWEISDLEEIPFTLLLPDTKINLIQHTRAVTMTALKVAQELLNFYSSEIKINLDVIIAGGILHDVGKLLEYHKEKGKITKSSYGNKFRHPVSGSKLAWICGLPDDIVHIIYAHSHEGDNLHRSPEAIIVNHCDFIDFHIKKSLVEK